MSGELGAVIYVSDLDAMVSFYTGVFALTAEQSSKTFVLLACGNTTVTLVQIPSHIAADFTVTTPPERRTDTPIKLSFAVANIETARLQAEALGGLIDPAHTEWTFGSVRVCDGHDPEGNVVQVREPA